MVQAEATSPLELAVSAAVEAARRARHLRPEALCVAAGISRASYYTRITAGGWRLAELERVAELLEVPLVDLLSDPDELSGRPRTSSGRSPSAGSGSSPRKSGWIFEGPTLVAA